MDICRLVITGAILGSIGAGIIATNEAIVSMAEVVAEVATIKLIISNSRDATIAPIPIITSMIAHH